MSPNPHEFLRHLQENGYHSRSNKHSNALAESIVRDLIRHCPTIAAKAKAGQLVYCLNFKLLAGTADWNVDLVLGPPEHGKVVQTSALGIAMEVPIAVEIAVELKAVMTEHRKAVKNRKRDLEAHHEHVHNYNKQAIAGGVLVINAAPTFQSPLRPAMTVHKDPNRLVEHCVNELRSVATRGGTTGYGLEAKCAIVVNADNCLVDRAAYVTAQPAPQVGDPLHYDAFLKTLCDCYRQRFA